MSCCLTCAEALAISTARAAVASTAGQLRSSEAANPQAPSAITRMPIPNDSESEALPSLPFLVERARLRSSAMRAAAYDAPRGEAASKAQEAMSFMAEAQFNTESIEGPETASRFREGVTVKLPESTSQQPA